MSLITKTELLTNLSRLMGNRVLPQGDHDDWTAYCQAAIDYAWRYYQWSWTMRHTNIAASGDYVPDDFDLDSYIVPITSSSVVPTKVSLNDYYMAGGSGAIFAFEWDVTVNKYKVLIGDGISSLQFMYQAVPPTLDDNTSVVFPSAMTLASGAVIFAKLGENPTHADVAQDWDLFKQFLNDHIQHAERTQTLHTNMNLYDSNGTYLGDVTQ